MTGTVVGTASNSLPTGGPPSPGRPREVATKVDLLEASVMLMIAVSVWRLQNLFEPLNTIKIQYLAPGLALLAFLADSDPRRAINRVTNPLMKKLLGVLVMVALSVPTSLWPGKSLDFLLDDHAKTILMMVLVAASIRSMADVRRYAILHIVGALVYSYVVTNQFQIGRSGRLGQLIYYDSNDFGLLLVCTIPLCVYFLRAGVNPIARVVTTGVLAFFVYTLVQTGSRGAFVGLIACGGYLLFNFGSITKRVRIYAVASLVAFLMIFGGDRYWEMMSSLLNPKDDYNWTADSGRKAVAIRGVGYMLTHPLTGVGARAFGQAEGMISNLAPRQAEGIGLKWSAAHNSFVEVGAELGVIGFVLFLAALLQAWRFVRTVDQANAGAQAGPIGVMGQAIGGVLIAYCFAGFFVSAGYSSFLYTIFGMVIGMMKLTAWRPGSKVPIRGKGRRAPREAGRPPVSGRRRGPIVLPAATSSFRTP